MVKFDYNAWLRDYCRENKVPVQAVEGVTRALLLSPKARDCETLNDWLATAHLGPLSTEATGALRAMWVALRGPKKPKRVKTTEEPATETEAVTTAPIDNDPVIL